MKRKATQVERIALFIAWPILAPVLLLIVAFAFVVVWPVILFTDKLEISS